MYLLNLFVERQLRSVRVYKDYEHALSDITDGCLGLLPDAAQGIDFHKPEKIVCTSEDDLGYGVDFKFIYINGFAVVIEKALPVD